ARKTNERHAHCSTSNSPPLSTRRRANPTRRDTRSRDPGARSSRTRAGDRGRRHRPARAPVRGWLRRHPRPATAETAPMIAPGLFRLVDGRYEVSFPDHGIEFTVDYLRRERHELWCELSVACGIVGA